MVLKEREFTIITAVNKLKIVSYSDLCSDNGTCLNVIVEELTSLFPGNILQ